MGFSTPRAALLSRECFGTVFSVVVVSLSNICACLLPVLYCNLTVVSSLKTVTVPFHLTLMKN